MKKEKKEKIIKSIENAKYMLVVTNNTMAAEGSLAEVMAMIISAIENLAENSPLTEEEILKEIKDVLKIKKEFDKKMEDNSLETDKMLEKLNAMKKFLEELKKYE
jgi:hypothetical protein|nr:MAG TPA: hypothetical protein [Caudoviricetes sp.]